MKHVGLLILACLLVGCTTDTAPVESSTPSTSFSSPGADADATPAAGSDVIVIDVRSEDEWNSGHVDQAIHIPHTEIGERISEVTDDKDAKIVLYCAVGGRAGMAKAKLEELGFTNIENGGGYEDVKGRFE